MYKHILSRALGLGLLLLPLTLSSCKQDKDTVESLMERNYPPRVYLQGDTYSAPKIQLELTHSGKTGLAGTAEGRFFVRLNRPVAQDVVVELRASIDQPELAQALRLSATEATIKAGELTSEELTVGLSDLTLLEGRIPEESYQVQVEVATLKAAPAGVLLSTNRNLYTATIHKEGRNEELLQAATIEGTVYFDQNDRASKWRVYDVSPVAEGADHPERLLDGATTDFATNAKPFAFTVDFGRVVDRFAGIVVQCWARWASPRGFKLEISTDGTTWLNMGVINVTPAQYHYLGLQEIRPARYVRCTVTRPAARTSLTEVWGLELPLPAPASN